MKLALGQVSNRCMEAHLIERRDEPDYSKRHKAFKGFAGANSKLEKWLLLIIYKHLFCFDFCH